MAVRRYLEQLNRMILEERLLEAFEKFCHEDVVMIEPGCEPRVGKEHNRQFEQDFLNRVIQWNHNEILSACTNEEMGISMIVWKFDVSMKDGTNINREQVTIQTWKGGKVMSEKFYY